MGLAYQSQADAFMRLNATVCMYKKEPYYINVDREQQDEVKLTPLNGGRSRTVKYTEDIFDYKPTELGYLNYRGYAAWLARLPARNQKQGLDSHSIKIIGDVYIGSDWFISKDFYNCVMGSYPSLSTAREQLDDDAFSTVAFTRNCALGRNTVLALDLYYRGHKVGYLNKKDNSITLKPFKGEALLKRCLASEGLNV